jgi:transcriptional regulator
MMQLRETDELIEAMREQARADCLAMTRQWGSHQPSYAQEESENGKKNLIRRMIKVKLLWLQDKTMVEISEIIKSDRSTVSKLLKMGREKLPDKESILRVMYMIEDGHKPATIAKEVGVTRQNVGHVRRKYWEPLKK